MDQKLTISIATLALLASACGEVTNADTAPRPEEMPDVVELERALPEPEATADPVGTVDSACRANLAQPFVGQTLNLESRTALLDAVEPQAIIRFIEDGEEIGEDTDPDRLNIRSDVDGAISEVFCG